MFCKDIDYKLIIAYKYTNNKPKEPRIFQICTCIVGTHYLSFTSVP